MPSPQPVILLHEQDDVAIAREPLAEGQVLPSGIRVASAIPFGHKVAVRARAKGEPVRRYNQIIGFASRPIAPGEHVHLQNLEMGDFLRDYAFCTEPITLAPAAQPRSFQGIVRPDGRVATRNYIGLISSVNCSATAVRRIADHFRGEALKDFPNVDGVVSIPQTMGCAVGNDSEAMEIMRRTMGGYIRHPNFAAVIVVGLGCESNQIASLFTAQGLAEGKLLRSMTIQETGGTGKTIARGIEMVKELLPLANAVTRVSVPASELVVALECGGSDSCSGISANPVLGNAVDRLVAQGGTAILSETPEIYGAEHLLTRRAVSEPVGRKLIERIRWWEEYCARSGAEMNNNPSAGNKEGGLTTILEKSLGAIAKAGNSALAAVYEYAEPVTARGMVFMDTPGYDAVATTGQIAGGSNLMVFTTGRGSAYGGTAVPSIKLASNTPLWNRQSEDMDLNCGGVVDGTASIDELGAELFEMMLRTASGEKTKSELFGYGELEFAPWHVGAVM
ncbi:Altronate hydrolase [Rhodovastum atsumiense]|uniref:Altronate dehydratase n=1 Tax=Rhodovastum atsumiense TaxID=504468 RepID=A0A5M6IRB1_9PROT|nr:altronate dehydratase family protein [Rhodovastum atsumiense]KAA5610711.1 altronate dehydratase [Rhodovastum atsumiense]CAH2603287.1 Altronate hydrolase [Rhodovastum atsumiense]